MAAVLHKLLRKPSSLRVITGFNNLRPSNVLNPFLSHENPDAKINADEQRPVVPLFGFPVAEKDPLQFYPRFPYGYSLKPIFPSGFEKSEAEEVDDGRMVWADSVKKKRKRKMNKHKYQKLRKKLRRKTKV